ncbi:MAG: hypothetical protein ACLGHY_01785 [Gammaproteobacteria bacterium]
MAIRPETLLALSKLSLKQHAVVLAMLHGMRNVRIAELMQCDRTIVSSHLNAALTHLRCTDRHHLKAIWGDRIAQISDEAYQEHFGLTKRWFETLDPELMALLTRKQSRGGAGAKKQGAQQAERGEEQDRSQDREQDEQDRR